MRVWYQLFILDVSGISLANKTIQIAKLALGISEQNFQKTAIVHFIVPRLDKFSILNKRSLLLPIDIEVDLKVLLLSL